MHCPDENEDSRSCGRKPQHQRNQCFGMWNDGSRRRNQLISYVHSALKQRSRYYNENPKLRKKQVYGCKNKSSFSHKSSKVFFPPQFLYFFFLILEEILLLLVCIDDDDDNDDFDCGGSGRVGTPKPDDIEAIFILLFFFFVF